MKLLTFAPAPVLTHLSMSIGSTQLPELLTVRRSTHRHFIAARYPACWLALRAMVPMRGLPHRPRNHRQAGFASASTGRSTGRILEILTFLERLTFAGCMEFKSDKTGCLGTSTVGRPTSGTDSNLAMHARPRIPSPYDGPSSIQVGTVSGFVAAPHLWTVPVQAHLCVRVPGFAACRRFDGARAVRLPHRMFRDRAAHERPDSSGQRSAPTSRRQRMPAAPRHLRFPLDHACNGAMPMSRRAS